MKWKKFFPHCSYCPLNSIGTAFRRSFLHAAGSRPHAANMQYRQSPSTDHWKARGLPLNAFCDAIRGEAAVTTPYLKIQSLHYANIRLPHPPMSPSLRYNQRRSLKYCFWRAFTLFGRYSPVVDWKLVRKHYFSHYAACSIHPQRGGNRRMWHRPCHLNPS